jgi:hypothetical protein
MKTITTTPFVHPFIDSYRKELASRAEAEEASSAALQALRAKNDQLVLELGRVENDALAASASAAAVSRCEGRKKKVQQERNRVELSLISFLLPLFLSLFYTFFIF